MDIGTAYNIWNSSAQWAQAALIRKGGNKFVVARTRGKVCEFATEKDDDLITLRFNSGADALHFFEKITEREVTV